jgi:hypothetical protein
MKALVILATLAAVAAAQQRPDALVEEVRQLRIQLQRSTAAQIAMQKVQMQQTRLDQLATRVEALRDTIVDRPAELERRLHRENDPQTRAELEQRIQVAKARVRREQHLSQQFATEERRLNQFWNELAQIEQTLTAIVAPVRQTRD